MSMDDPKKTVMMKGKPRCVNCVYFERQPPTQETYEVLLPQLQFYPCREFVREELRKAQPRFDSGIFQKAGISYKYRCRINKWGQFNQRDFGSEPKNLEKIQRERKCSSFMYYEKEFDRDPDYVNRIALIKQERSERAIKKVGHWTLIIASLTLLIELFSPISMYPFFKSLFYPTAQVNPKKKISSTMHMRTANSKSHKKSDELLNKIPTKKRHY